MVESVSAVSAKRPREESLTQDITSKKEKRTFYYFGSKDWSYEVGSTPPIPKNIDEKLKEFREMCQKHNVTAPPILALVPESFHLDKFRVMMEKTDFAFQRKFSEKLSHVKEVSESSHWVLMSSRRFFHGEGKGDEMKQLLSQGYDYPTFSEVAACSLAVQNYGRDLLASKKMSPSYTHCKAKSSDKTPCYAFGKDNKQHFEAKAFSAQHANYGVLPVLRLVKSTD